MKTTLDCISMSTECGSIISGREGSGSAPGAQELIRLLLQRQEAQAGPDPLGGGPD